MRGDETRQRLGSKLNEMLASISGEVEGRREFTTNSRTKGQ
jgi:hypothetical protein